MLGLAGLTSLALLEPVSVGDTDLWYHLAGGRYLFENGELYNPYVVSFLAPAEHFINYFWGFQATVYGLWLLMGDMAPIVLRALLVVPCAFLMLKILHLNDLARSNLVHLILAMLMLYMLAIRLESVRPHLATLFFIALFLFILLYKEKWFPLLPLLAVLWANLHGVGWAIGAVICGSYFLTQLIYRWQNDVPLQSSLWWVVACGPAILLNPWGVYILPTPFLTEQSLSLLISELRFFEFKLNWPIAQGLAFHPSVAVLLGFSVLAFLTACRKWSDHLFPLLISVVSFALFLRGQRFVWECMLLCTPLLAVYANRFHQVSWVRKNTTSSMITSGVLLYSLNVVYTSQESYPVGNAYPRGSTEFLKTLQLDTEYALPPTLAGYAEWHLTPGYRIHSDMQFPPFKAVNHFEYHSIQYSAASFERFVRRYSPGLVAVPRSVPDFAESAASQGYQSIFFDRHLVLFANKHKLPDVVSQFGLTAIDPFDVYRVAGNHLPVAEKELRRVLKYDVSNHQLRSVLAHLLIDSNQFDEASKVLDSDLVSQSALLQNQLGMLLKAKGDFGQATELLGDAYRVLQERLVGFEAADAAFLAEQPAIAFELYEQTLNPYLDAEYEMKHIYQYALSALVIGENRRAKDLYDVLLIIDGHNGVVMTKELKAFGLLLDGQD